MNICLVGCGGIANSSHGPALAAYAAEHPDVTLSACCDIDAQRAEAFRAVFGFARSYTDYRAMVAAERPQAVCLLSPVQRTAEIARDLLAQGLPLLLEKPPGLTLAEAESIQAAALASGAPHLVAFNRRFTPLVERFQAAFAERFRPGDIQHIHYEMARVGRADPDFSTTAVHGIDTAAFLAGSPYRRVTFHYQPLPEYGPAVANVYLDCAFASGATGHLSFLPVTGALTERAAVFAHGNAYSIYLPLSGGYDHPGRLLHLENGREVLSISGPEAAGGPEDWRLNGFYRENAAFLDALRAGTRPPAGIETALQSVAVMQAMRERKAVWEE